MVRCPFSGTDNVLTSPEPRSVGGTEAQKEIEVFSPGELIQASRIEI